MSTSHAKKVGVAALVGSLIPGFWGLMAFVFFNAKESLWSRFFWDAVYITCPVWVINTPYDMILMPLLNAGVYAVCALGFFAARRPQRIDLPR